MKTIQEFLNQHFSKAALVLLVMIFFNTCGNPNRITDKRLNQLTAKIDSIQLVLVTHNDLRIEGLKAEKRMIQATDRKILDVNRQTDIEKEIQLLEE